jgi:hypothetical protein
MKTIGALILMTSVVLGACAPQVDATQTALAGTQVAAQTMAVVTQQAESAMATGSAATMTAAAPTATSTPVPPTATETVVPSPTPSGKNEFFDVAVDQVSPDEIDVSFGFQLAEDIKLGDVHIGALPVGCDSLLPSVGFRFYDPTTYSGLATGPDVVHLNLNQAGTCQAKGVQLIVFIPNQAGYLYEQTFDIPFSLVKQ